MCSTSTRGSLEKVVSITCPYGWKCPVSFILNKYGQSRFHAGKPLYDVDARCYVCKGLVKGEFQLFITIRPPPWAIADSKTALELLAKLAKELANSADMLYLKAVIAVSIGKIVRRGERLVERVEIPHIHILVGAKRRVGRFRVPRRVRIRRLMEFRDLLKSNYSNIFGGLYKRCIDVKWIRYDDKTRKRKKRRRSSEHGRGKFRLRAYIFKQLVPIGYKPIIVGIHIRRYHKTPSTNVQTHMVPDIIRGYSYDGVSLSGGMGGYWGLASRRDEELSYGDVARLLARLYLDLSKGVFMDLQLRSRILKSSLVKLIRALLKRVNSHDVEVQDAMQYLFAMYSLADIWIEMSEVVKAVIEEWSDDTVEELIKNYSIRLPNLVSSIIWLSHIDAEVGRKLLHYILDSMKMRLENSLKSSKAYGVDGILGIAVRFQILSKKRVQKLLRDLRYAEHMLDKDSYNAAVSIIRIGNTIADYIERSWKQIRKISVLSSTRRRTRYGKKDSKELRFVKAVKSLIKQIKSLKKVLVGIEGLENIRYLERDEFVLEAKIMLRNSFPCFLYAGHVVCVDVSDIGNALAEAEEVARYATAFCRYCLGIRVKPPIEPCYESDNECWSRFCSLYDEFFELVEHYRGLMRKLRRNLRARAKMRKKRYSARLRSLVYKFSKLKSIDEYIYGKNVDAFKRALSVFDAWLRKRGYRKLYEFDPKSYTQSSPKSTEAYERFVRIIFFINGWSDKIVNENNDDYTEEQAGEHCQSR